MKNYKLEKLLNGETFITNEKGSSMVPLIKSGQNHKLEPVIWENCNVDDIVYCKVKGHFYTHLVKAKNNDKGLLIGNNKGHINGWTKQVYGKVIEIFIMEIEKVKAYKISDKLFETIEEANDYKYQKIDNVELGDIVSTGFKNFYGNFGFEGKVCCIEGDLIWFLDGNCPQEWIMTGKIKYSCDILKINNRTYSWKVMARYRKDLWRRPLSWLD